MLTKVIATAALGAAILAGVGVANADTAPANTPNVQEIDRGHGFGGHGHGFEGFHGGHEFHGFGGHEHGFREFHGFDHDHDRFRGHRDFDPSGGIDALGLFSSLSG